MTNFSSLQAMRHIWKGAGFNEIQSKRETLINTFDFPADISLTGGHGTALGNKYADWNINVRRHWPEIFVTEINKKHSGLTGN